MSTTLRAVRDLLKKADMAITFVEDTDEYRVNFRKGGTEASAYYTNDLDDACKTGLDMAKRRDAGRTAQASPVTHVYPDTSHGVLMMLKDNANSEITAYLKEARTWRDPSVEGVWLVELDDVKKRRVIAYLAGYRDPMHRRRDMNDFEVED